MNTALKFAAAFTLLLATGCSEPDVLPVVLQPEPEVTAANAREIIEKGEPQLRTMIGLRNKLANSPNADSINRQVFIESIDEDIEKLSERIKKARSFVEMGPQPAPTPGP